MMGIRTPPESGYALFTDNPVNAVEHCLQASVKVGIARNGPEHAFINSRYGGISYQQRDSSVLCLQI